jgi:hypothetical protein
LKDWCRVDQVICLQEQSSDVRKKMKKARSLYQYQKIVYSNKQPEKQKLNTI